MPNWCANFSDPIMSFWLEAERVDERLRGLLRANQGRDDKTVDWKIGEERGKKLGLTVTSEKAEGQERRYRIA